MAANSFNSEYKKMSNQDPREVVLCGDVLRLGGRTVCVLRETSPRLVIFHINDIDATPEEKELLVVEVKRFYSQFMYELDRAFE